MTVDICAVNVPDAYPEAMQKMRVFGREEDSRVGKVITIPEPVVLTIQRPRQRVLFDPVRNANPFFHVMETVWMLAGRNDLKWIEQFNSRMKTFADEGARTLHGAYGFRWREHFNTDQIVNTVNLLKKDRTTRRAVIGMWDPAVDFVDHGDLPCNTSIMFRYFEGRGLDMTVINRSNDLVWGMLGANCVHMTFLHELIAAAAGLPLGWYKVFTNNLHIYKDREDFKGAWDTVLPVDHYKDVTASHILWKGETLEMFLGDATLMTHGVMKQFRTEWFNSVAAPMYDAYMERKHQLSDGMDYVRSISASDWRLACSQWIERKSSSTSTERSPSVSTESTS